MKLKKKLTAVAAGLGLVATAGTAGAFSLGEVWLVDQNNADLYIYAQGSLNNPWVDSEPMGTLSLISQDVAGGASGKAHLVAFNNKDAFASTSRAMLAYLSGEMQIFRTNAGTGAPTLVATIDVSNADAGKTANSLHMCGPSPDNRMIGCSSIGNKELIFYKTRYRSDTYTDLGSYPLASLQIHPSLSGQALAETRAAIDAGILAGKPICNNFTTDSKFSYVTVSGGAGSGVLILQTNRVLRGKPPLIVGAYAGTAVGCGLVNSQDGTSMWTNAGSKALDDNEQALLWEYADIGVTAQPAAIVDLPDKGDGGDVHGAQFAGIGGSFLWEVMRLDDVIHVIEPASAAVVNSIDLETAEVVNPGADVLDRDQTGTSMYMSLRGPAPITAITGSIDADRTPGILVMSTLYGYNGYATKTERIFSGNTIFICPPDEHDDGEHDHDDDDLVCNEGDPGAVEVDSADPHGLKSLNYLTGGF
jgi:hypothetical protein